MNQQTGYNEDLPSIREELTGKALDALETILRRERTGDYSRAQASAAVDAVFACVSGLVDRDIFEIVTQVSDHFEDKDDSFYVRQVFREPLSLRMVVVERQVGEGRVRVVTPGKIKIFEASSAQSALSKVEAISENLIRSGYRRLTNAD